jgi:hypothetical protein
LLASVCCGDDSSLNCLISSGVGSVSLSNLAKVKESSLAVDW